MKNFSRFFNSTQFVVTLSVLFNVGIFLVLSFYVGIYAYLLLCLACLIVFCFFTMFSKNQPTVKFMIALFMAILPLTATVIYTTINNKRGSKTYRKEWQNVKFKMSEKLIQDDNVFSTMDLSSVEQVKLSKYVYATTHMPIYSNSNVTYFPKSDKFLKELLEDLQSAKKFILISLFKVANSEIWDEVFQILKERRLNGVEVKLIYDDFGCIKTFKDKSIFEKLKNHGIETLCFNKIKGVGNFKHYRNKKNIIIVDNSCAYCSALGINDDVLLDAKISKTCAIKITGEAIKSVFAEFYSDWCLFSKEKIDWDNFSSKEISNIKTKKPIYIQPFISTPFSQDLVNKSIYSCLIANANKSIIISTPYLLLDDELKNELIRSVRSGVDVKILVAGKGERTKKCKFALSRYEFIKLISEGIKIYSYATDNLFNRCIVADSKTVIIGGGAFDSRKTSIHFEHGTLIHSEDIAKQVRDDVEATMEVSHLLTIKDMRQRRLSEKSLARLLNVFSPFYL